MYYANLETAKAKYKSTRFFDRNAGFGLRGEKWHDSLASMMKLERQNEAT